MFRPLTDAVVVAVAVVVAFYRDGDPLRDQRRVEREMIAVAQDQLQRVLSLRQVEERLGLAPTEVQMLFVVRDRLVGIDCFLRVDQQVMMTDVGEITAGGSNSHAAQTEATPECAFHGGPILRIDDVKQGVLRCRLCLSQCSGGWFFLSTVHDDTRTESEVRHNRDRRCPGHLPVHVPRRPHIF